MNQVSKSVMVSVAALAALALATRANAQSVYGACAKVKNGVERVRQSSIVVDQSPTCKNTEFAVSWNQQGAQGPQGVVGNCHVEEFPGTAQANTFAVLTSTCASGLATGSSAIWHTPFDAADNGPFYILPRTANTWTVVPWNHTGTAQDYRFFLQCCG